MAPRHRGEVQPPLGRAHHDFAVQRDVAAEVLPERGHDLREATGEGAQLPGLQTGPPTLDP
jgi:hypothetical protein